jgi:hypothetical protein
MSSPGPAHLSNHHRDTLLQLFQEPVSHNVEWRAVLSLLEAVGSVEARDGGVYVVDVGGEHDVFTRPHGKDVDIDVVHDVRRMMQRAGYGPLVAEMEAKGKEV